MLRTNKKFRRQNFRPLFEALENRALLNGASQILLDRRVLHLNDVVQVPNVIAGEQVEVLATASPVPASDHVFLRLGITPSSEFWEPPLKTVSGKILEIQVRSNRELYIGVDAVGVSYSGSVTVTVLGPAPDASLSNIRPSADGGVDVDYKTDQYLFAPGVTPQIQLFYLTGDTVAQTDLQPISNPVAVTSTPNSSATVHIFPGKNHQLPQPPANGTGVVALLVDRPAHPLSDANIDNNFAVKPIDQILPDYQAVYLTQLDDGVFQLHYNVVGAPTPLAQTQPVVDLVWAMPSTANSYGYDKVKGTIPLAHKSLDPTSTVGATSSTEMDFDVKPSVLANPPQGATGVMAVLDYNNSVTEVTRSNNLAYHALPIVASLKLTSTNLLGRTGSDWEITGVALDASGNPVANAPVMMSDALRHVKNRSLGRTDNYGEFTIDYSAEETREADPGLYLSAIHSGSASLYIKYALTSGNLALDGLPTTPFSLQPVADQSKLDTTTLIYAHKAPGINPPPLTVSNLLKWGEKVTSDLTLITQRAALDTVLPDLEEPYISTPVEFSISPAHHIEFDFEPLTELPFKFGFKFLDELIKKDSSATPALKKKLKTAVDGGQFVSDIVLFKYKAESPNELYQTASKIGEGAIDLTKFVVGAYKLLPGSGNHPTTLGMTLANKQGDTLCLTVAATPTPPPAPVPVPTPVVIPKDLSKPKAPTNLQVQAADASSVTLSFTPSASGGNTRIAMSTDGTNFNNVGQTSGSTFTVTGLATGTNYIFKIRDALNGAYSDYTPTITATTRVATPVAPTNLRVTAIDSTSLTLAFDAPIASGVVYRVARSFDGTNFDHIGDTSGTTFLVSNLAPGAHAWFEVRANQNGVFSSYSNIVDAVLPSPPPPPPPAANPTPATPTNLRAANVYKNAADLNWTDNSNNETAFRVAISTDGVNWNNVAVTEANAMSVRISNLAANTVYYVKIRAANGTTYSDYSNTITIKSKAS